MTRKRWRRRTISIAASLLAHLALLSPLLRRAPDLRMTAVASRPDVQIDLVRTMDANRGAQPSAKPSLKETAQRPKPNAGAQASPAPAPTWTANLPSASATGAGATSEMGEAQARAALRAALGCLNPDLTQLTEAERATCRDRLRQAATALGDATVDPIRSIRKRAYYDEVKGARDAMNSYNPVSGPMPGNGPGFGCKFGGKSGGSCGVALPSGALTEEWGIKPP